MSAENVIVQKPKPTKTMLSRVDPLQSSPELKEKEKKIQEQTKLLEEARQKRAQMMENQYEEALRQEKLQIQQQEQQKQLQHEQRITEIRQNKQNMYKRRQELEAKISKVTPINPDIAYKLEKREPEQPKVNRAKLIKQMHPQLYQWKHGKTPKTAQILKQIPTMQKAASDENMLESKKLAVQKKEIAKENQSEVVLRESQKQAVFQERQNVEHHHHEEKQTHEQLHKHEQDEEHHQLNNCFSKYAVEDQLS
ncbi:Hypothetical_protein [Hexamita inflata]|uniref:Hypothetical_protein n=1 Tax=Hexamita inflata TaxID=28002 RepID=A0AA86USK5_9EUKA|nr:Hypothetical protein HINF_LOCUS35988 [Hexamita inflata]